MKNITYESDIEVALKGLYIDYHGWGTALGIEDEGYSHSYFAGIELETEEEVRTLIFSLQDILKKGNEINLRNEDSN